MSERIRSMGVEQLITNLCSYDAQSHAPLSFVERDIHDFWSLGKKIQKPVIASLSCQDLKQNYSLVDKFWLHVIHISFHFAQNLILKKKQTNRIIQDLVPRVLTIFKMVKNSRRPGNEGGGGRGGEGCIIMLLGRKTAVKEFIRWECFQFKKRITLSWIGVQVM